MTTPTIPLSTAETERPCPNCGVTLNGHSGLRYLGMTVTHSHADCIRHLNRAKEAAEAERDQWKEAFCRTMEDKSHWQDEHTKAEAEAAALRGLIEDRTYLGIKRRYLDGQLSFYGQVQEYERATLDQPKESEQ